MKLDLAHVAAAVGLVALAYMYGKKRATTAATATADTNIQAPADWWNYAGMWNSQ